jgi:hypothetical protein
MSRAHPWMQAIMWQDGDIGASRRREMELMPRHESRIARDPRVVVLERTRDSVMLDVAHGRRIKLNRLGLRIWEALATEPTFGALVDLLWTDYDVRIDVLALDVASMLALWADAGLISWR